MGGVTACATDDSEMDEEDGDEDAEEELELDQSSELYKTIVAAIIKEEDDDGDLEEDDGDIEEDAFDELEDAGAKAESQTAGVRVIKRATGAGARRADEQ